MSRLGGFGLPRLSRSPLTAVRYGSFSVSLPDPSLVAAAGVSSVFLALPCLVGVAFFEPLPFLPLPCMDWLGGINLEFKSASDLSVEVLAELSVFESSEPSATNLSEAEFMQYRNPVGAGPSENTCPK